MTKLFLFQEQKVSSIRKYINTIHNLWSSWQFPRKRLERFTILLHEYYRVLFHLNRQYLSESLRQYRSHHWDSRGTGTKLSAKARAAWHVLENLISKRREASRILTQELRKQAFGIWKWYSKLRGKLKRSKWKIISANKWAK